MAMATANTMASRMAATTRSMHGRSHERCDEAAGHHHAEEAEADRACDESNHDATPFRWFEVSVFMMAAVAYPSVARPLQR